MLRKGWNFRGDIAVCLEGDAIRHFKESNRPFGKIYDASAIEQGGFAEVMIILVRSATNYNYENTIIDEFVKDCAHYIGIDGNQIDPEVANDLYQRFKSIIEK